MKRYGISHLLLATLENPDDPLSWSGTPYSLHDALKKLVDRVTVVGNLKPKRTLRHGVLRWMLGGQQGPRYPLWMTDPALHDFAQSLQKAIDTKRPDAVLSISSQCLIYLPRHESIPVAMFSDAPWLSWKKAYNEPLPVLGKRYAGQEARAATRCDALFFGSKWACDEAERLYDVPASRLHVCPFGASWTPRLSEEQLLQRIQSRGTEKLQLLFLGKDWERKGGPLAIEIAGLLHARGIPVVLHVVGCSPDISPELAGVVRVHGLLRRSDETEAAKMRELFLSSHFLLTPTTAECFGLVFAEALAHGLPPISRRVQAVPSIVEDDVTGILEDANAPASAYVERIAKLFRDQERYLEMARCGRQHYTAAFTWEACAATIVRTLDKISSEGRSE